ncbi:MAG: hypothetical protein ACTHJR_11210 [Sphingomonas sp.]|uniref:hypothetical protein n=1 Tax=Sphingomonas sp. TaxID=28214 RepID=UPI003F816630
MVSIADRGRLSVRRIMLAGCAATIAIAGAAHAAVYVENKLVELTAAEKVAVTNPPPVQLISEFQTDGVANAKATKYASPIIEKEVAATGVFGATSATPLANGGRLTILMNDIPDKGAAKKGFAAGLTLGLAGVIAGDTYDVTSTYTPANGAPIVKVEHYRIIFKFGNKTLPPDVVKVKGFEEAAKTMIHLTVSHTLNAIAGDPAYPAASGATVVIPVAAAAPAPSPAATAPAS